MFFRRTKRSYGSRSTRCVRCFAQGILLGDTLFLLDMSSVFEYRISCDIGYVLVCAAFRSEYKSTLCSPLIHNAPSTKQMRSLPPKRITDDVVVNDLQASLHIHAGAFPFLESQETRPAPLRVVQ